MDHLSFAFAVNESSRWRFKCTQHIPLIYLFDICVLQADANLRLLLLLLLM